MNVVVVPVVVAMGVLVRQFVVLVLVLMALDEVQDDAEDHQDGPRQP
jgi:hypothetical protein